MYNNNPINTNTLTYRELKALVPEAPRRKLTAKKLEGEEILFTAQVDDASITIFKNGYLTYTKTDDYGKPHSTVYAVHRCSKIIFQVGYSKEEYEEGWDSSALADQVAYRFIDGQLTKLHIIKEDRYLDGPWWMPICVICEERMRHNQSSREEYRSEFSLDASYENEEGEEISENWNPALAGPDTCEAWMEEQAEREEKAENHRKLMEAMKTLTEIQRQTVDLFYSNPGMAEAKLAKVMGVNQSTVHRNLKAAIKNLQKAMH